MASVELGRIGAAIAPSEGPELVETAVGLEAMGFETIWLTGGPLTSLQQVADVVRATDHVTVATGILAVVRWTSEEATALFTDLEGTDPGRFAVGLGRAQRVSPPAWVAPRPPVRSRRSRPTSTDSTPCLPPGGCWRRSGRGCCA